MLWNPKWGRAKKKTASLAGLIAWLETQDPTTEYTWFGDTPCLIEQYAAAIGLSTADLYDSRGKRCNLYDTITTTECIAAMGERTFAAALERARGALSRDAKPNGSR